MVGNKVWKARRAATHQATIRFLSMLFQPVRITREPDEPGMSDGQWYAVHRGPFKLSGGGGSVLDAKRATSLAIVEQGITIALKMLESLHGPMTSTALFKATLAALPFKLESHHELWNAYGRLMEAGLIKFTPSAGNGLGGRVEVVS
jgi:hypothetical protein